MNWPIICGGVGIQKHARSIRISTPQLWEEAGHNPVRFLSEVEPTCWSGAADNSVYLARYDEVLATFDHYMHPRPEETWFSRTYPELGKQHYRLFLGGIRAARGSADLFRWPGHSFRRPL